MDLKNFHKIAQDKHHTTLQHPDGHIIKLAHNAMPYEQRQELKRIPLKEQHFAHGTPEPVAMTPEDEKRGYIENPPVLDTSGDGIYPMPPAAAREPASDKPYMLQDLVNDAKGAVSGFMHGDVMKRLTTPIPGTSSPFEGGSRTTAPAAAPQASAVPGTAPVRQPQIAVPQGAATDNFSLLQGGGDGLKQMIAGMQGITAADRNQAKGMYEASQMNQADANEINQRHAHEIQLHEDRKQQLVRDFNEAKIEPHGIFHNKDSIGKITTALGIMMGGIGSGLNGQPNQVMKFLDDQIARDIDAQKANLGKKKSLLDFHMQQGVSLEHSHALAKSEQLAIAANRMEQQVLKNADPRIKAQGQALVGQLKAQSEAAAAPALKAQAVKYLVKSGKMTSEEAINHIPEKHQAAAQKALEGYRGLEAFNKALHENNSKLKSMVLSGAFSPKKRDAIVDNLAGHLSKVTAGRFNLEESKKQVGAVLYSTMDDLLGGNDTHNTKDENIDQLTGSMQAEHLPVLEQYGIAPLPPSKGRSHNKSER